MNKKLQSEMITLIRCKSVIKALIPKLSFYKENNERNVLSQFPNLCENNITDERLRYCSHLHNLVEDMHIRFADLSFNVPRWVIQPFSTDPADLQLNFKISLSTCKMMMTKYPLTWNEVRAWIVSDILFRWKRIIHRDTVSFKTKKPSFHQQTGYLWLYQTKMSPNIKKLAEA